MTENAELQAKIAALSGQINQHKQHKHQPFKPSQHRTRGHWSPYGRSGRAGYPQPHKNRTLVLSGTQNSPPPASTTTDFNTATLANASIAADSFVSARGPGKKSLMNKDTYEREQKQVLEHKETALEAKRQKIDREERTTLMHHVNASPASGSRELVVDGIRFQLRDDGSKLIRIPGKPPSIFHDGTDDGELNGTDASTGTKETRKQVKIAGVDFYRTKNGNLVRANAVRDRIRYFVYTGNAICGQNSLRIQYRPADRKQTSQCEHFTKHGTQYPYELTSRLRTQGRVRGKNLVQS